MTTTSHRFELDDFLLLSDPDHADPDLPEWAVVRDVDLAGTGYYLLSDEKQPGENRWFEIAYIDSHYGRSRTREEDGIAEDVP